MGTWRLLGKQIPNIHTISISSSPLKKHCHWIDKVFAAEALNEHTIGLNPGLHSTSLL